MCYMIDPRSDDNYGLSDDAELAYSWQWPDIIWFPVFLLCVLFVLPLLPFLLLVGYALSKPFSIIWGKIRTMKRSYLGLILAVIMIAEALGCVYLIQQIRALPPRHWPKQVSMLAPAGAPIQTVTTASQHPLLPTAARTAAPSATPVALLQAPMTLFTAYAPPTPKTPVAVERDKLVACAGCYPLAYQ
jgi:hypothetical protein